MTEFRIYDRLLDRTHTDEGLLPGDQRYVQASDYLVIELTPTGPTMGFNPKPITDHEITHEEWLKLCRDAPSILRVYKIERVI